MTRPDDHETAAFERLLARRSRHAPPPELRTRVLAAVDGVLRDDRPVRRLEPAGRFEPLMIGGLLVTALSLVLVVTLSSVVACQRGGPSADHPLLSFARRAEAAGIAVELDPPTPERLASAQAHSAAGPRRGDLLQVLDARRLLKGEL